MKTFKMVYGYFLLGFASILTLALVLAIPNALADEIAEIKAYWSGGIPFAIGTIIGIVLALLIIIFPIKYGLRLIKSKNVEK